MTTTIRVRVETRNKLEQHKRRLDKNDLGEVVDSLLKVVSVHKMQEEMK